MQSQEQISLQIDARGKNMLPEYLRFSPDAKPNLKNTIVRGDKRFTILSSCMIRIECGEFTDSATLTVINRSFDNPGFTLNESDDVLEIKTEHLKLSYVLNEPLTRESLNIELLQKPYTKWFYGDKESFNLGGTLSTLDRINGEYDIQDGICSLDGYSVIDDSKTALITNDGWFKNRSEDITDIYFLGYGHDYTSCVKDYYRLTGVPGMLPAFVLGNWWSRYHRYSDKEYLDLMDKFHDKDIPISVAILDMDWHTIENHKSCQIPGDWAESGWTGYTWNKELFPDYKEFIKKIHKRNLKTALNLHPHLGVRSWESMYPQMAEAMGMNPSEGKPVPFDCLDPKFLKAYFEILHFPYEKDGIDFWWLDWQQGTSYWWNHFYGGEEKELEKSVSPLWLLDHMHYLASKRDGKRGLIFSRFAGYGSQRYPIGFSGDTYISWQSLNFQPYFTTTASNIGYGWWSHDIGGHLKGDNDEELTARWVQFGVFSPIFRMHCACDVLLGREPWNFNTRTEQVISDFMRLRHRMFPYLYTMNYRNFKDLLPLIRPMYHTYPENKKAYSVKNQYWFGSEMIVAPITQKSDTVSELGRTKVWLPDGKWIDWFNGYVYKSGKIEVYRTLEQMPIFLKAGAIVPLQPHCNKDNHLGLKDTVEVVIAAGASNEFDLYEDDGLSTNYENGDFCITRLSLQHEDNKEEFTVLPSSGNTALVPEKRSYKLIFKGYKSGCSFYVSGIEIEAEYYPKTNEYAVCVDKVLAAEGITVTIKNDTGLLHDNSDFDSRAFEIIAHSNCSPMEQMALMNERKAFKNYRFKTPESTYGSNRVYNAIYELAVQLKQK